MSHCLFRDMIKHKSNIHPEILLVAGFVLICFFVLTGLFMTVENLSAEEIAKESFISNVRNILFIVFLVFIVFSCVIVYDAFLNRRYREELVKHKDKIKLVSEVKQRFISNMSHEMKTPLHTIVGISKQMMEGETLGLRREELFQKLGNSSQQLLKMVENLLMFADGDMALNLRDGSFDPNEVFEETLEPYKQMALQKNLKFAFNCTLPSGKQLKGSDFELKEVLKHLLDNSLKFTSKGCIEVSCSIKGIGDKHGLLMLSVTDTGVGIAEEFIPYIFDGFDKTNSEEVLTKEFPGIGLGLALTKRIVDMRGGNIKVESVQGESTRISVSLPYMYSQENGDKNNLLAKQNIHPRILVVDDDEFNVLLATSFLKKRECVVTATMDASEGLKLLATQVFDLVLLDIHMPKISGLQIAESLRKSNHANHNIPILAVTATSLNENLISNFKTVGINDFLPKPYSDIQLWQKITYLVEKEHSPLIQQISA